MKIPQLKVDYDTPLKKQLKELGVKNYLDLDKIKDLHPRPQDDLIYDVEDGEEMKGKSPEDCEKEFKKQGKRGLTIYEGLALLRNNPKLLKNHCVDLVGSRCGSSDGVPGLFLYDAKPGLGWGYTGSAYDYGGSASCGSRVLGLDKLESLENRVVDLEQKIDKLIKIINI